MNKPLARMMSFLVVVAVLCASSGPTVGPAVAQDAGPLPPQEGLALAGVGFTYQGRLASGGSPVSATCSMNFRLYDAASGGLQVGSAITQTDVLVSDGLFSVLLNSGGEFGAQAFDGSARWLGIAVQCPPDAGFTSLAPRQALTPAPYAYYAGQAPWAGMTDVPAGFADGVDHDTTYSAGAGLTLVGTTFNLRLAGSGSAHSAARSDHDHTSDYWALGGNSATSDAHYLGTSDNTTLTLAVSGTAALRLVPNDTYSPNIIGGYSGNSVPAGVVGAVIAGGGNSWHINTASGSYATVGGGVGNTASWPFATVSGGDENIASEYWATVSGGVRNTASAESATVSGGHGNTAGHFHATVGGGYINTASGWESTVGGGGFNTASVVGATVGGGSDNTASGWTATVGGGKYNTASGHWSTVSGGTYNTASGDYSFAAGRLARAIHEGAFVWADSTWDVISSTTTNQFLVRASGGVTMFTNSTATTGVAVYPGSGTWTSASDRNLKANFTPVDGRDVLAALVNLPLETWNYQAQDASIRHMGPMAQDFHAAFGLGETDLGISAVDADGIALAAIQGLHSLVVEKDAEIAALRAEQDALQSRLLRLEQAAGIAPAAGASPWLLGLTLAALAALIALAGGLFAGRRWAAARVGGGR